MQWVSHWQQVPWRLPCPPTPPPELYSAADLLDSDVYDSTGKKIGEVEDILLGKDMGVYSLVIETGEVLGLGGGRDVAAGRGTFTVRLEEGDNRNEFGDQDFEVYMEGTEAEIKSLPLYDESWWEKTSHSLQQAWEDTKEASASAWESAKEATSEVWYDLEAGVEEIGDEAEGGTN